MADDDDLKLNSLARYKKQSPRLVLEEYSSCEVPAGCGGAVLRWRKPKEPIMWWIHLWTFTGETQIDGKQRWHRTTLGYGEHLLSVELGERVDIDPQVAVLYGYLEVDTDYRRVAKLEGDLKIATVADGSWRFHTGPFKGDAWRQVDFDDSDWPALVERPPNTKPDPNMRYSYDFDDDLFRQQREAGARHLGIPPQHPLIEAKYWKPGARLPRLYIRKRFRFGPAEEK